MVSTQVAAVIRASLRARCLEGEDAPSAADAAAEERARARRLEDLTVTYRPKQGTVTVRGRPGDADAPAGSGSGSGSDRAEPWRRTKVSQDVYARAGSARRRARKAARAKVAA